MIGNVTKERVDFASRCRSVWCNLTGTLVSNVRCMTVTPWLGIKPFVPGSMWMPEFREFAVLIDKQSLRDGIIWIGLSGFALAGVAALYPWTSQSAGGSSGGSAYGLAVGIIGTLMIAFAMALIVRKTWRTLRIGRTYMWLQGHVWLGLVSYFIIWFHAGWRWGGALTTGLMIAFTLVWATGIIGLFLQNLIPFWLIHKVPHETVYEQIDEVGRENLKSARRLVRARLRETAAVGNEASASRTTEGETPASALKMFYEGEIRPYLADGLRLPPASWWFPWRSAIGTGLTYQSSRRVLPPPASAFSRMRNRYPGLFEVVNSLEDFVEQRKQHRLQKKLHWVMHGWLLVHVPLSVVMIILIPVHALLAARY